MIKTTSLELSKRLATCLSKESEFSSALINRGVYPGRRKYSKVVPRGIYKLSPLAWKQAKQLERTRDFSYEILMNQYRMSAAKYYVMEINR